MTNEEHLRLTEALVKKARLMHAWPEPPLPDDEILRKVIGMAVADTSLVMDGTVPIEAFDPGPSAAEYLPRRTAPRGGLRFDLDLDIEGAVGAIRSLAPLDGPVVGPHEFGRQGWRWWLCRHCFAPRSLHPRDDWVRARPMHDHTYIGVSAPHWMEGW